jgi:hypothetical protein
MLSHRTWSERPARPSWRKRARGWRALSVLAVVALAACGGMDDESADEASSEGGATPPGFTDERDAPAATGGDIYADDADTADGFASGPVPEVDPGVPNEQLDEPSAGSVDDNQLWDEYLRYRSGFLATGIPASAIAVEGRQLLTVVDVDGDPVLGAQITILDAAGNEVSRLRTYADGRAVFLAGTAVDPTSQARPAYTARVTKGQVATEVTLEAGALSQSITLDADLPSPAQVDVMFLIDTTGSMSDEIERLKASMISVSEQLAALPSAPDARFGMVLYRDRGDEYVTRTFDFTPDIFTFTAALEGVVADGGGDTPESLGAGLQDALGGPTWRGDDTVKLVFLLSDAAPHLPSDAGYADEPDYAQVIRDIAADGVKVFPIASSGLDDQGEFIFRQLAQVTMGRFVFLTYGADGRTPGDSTPMHVDPEDYDVLALDALVVQLVSDELAHLA